MPTQEAQEVQKGRTFCILKYAMQKRNGLYKPLFFFGFKIPDTVAPKISKVEIFSLHHEGVVINAFENATYKVSNEEGENKILGPQVINVFGSIGLGIEASDKMNSADKNYNLGHLFSRNENRRKQGLLFPF